MGAVAVLVSTAFGLSTLERFVARRKPHELAWTVSLAMFALASFAYFWAAALGWGSLDFRAFYLFGAILNVPWLALGTVHLLAGRRAASITQRWLLLLSGLSVGVMLVAPTKIAVAGGELPTGKDVFGVAPRVLAAVGSGVAAIVIIGGAVWSAWRLWRQRRAHGSSNAGAAVAPSSRLVLGNLLIALGTLVLSASGTLAGRLGKDQAFAVTLLIGICVLFAGFLVAPTSARPRPVRAGSDE